MTHGDWHLAEAMPTWMTAGWGPLRTEEMLQGLDFSLLRCSETRVAADGGLYSCPILAGLLEPRLSEGCLQESFTPHHCVAPETVFDEVARGTLQRLIVLDGKLNRYRHNGQVPVALAFRRHRKWEQLFASRCSWLSITREPFSCRPSVGMLS